MRVLITDRKFTFCVHGVLATQTDKGIVLAETMVIWLRQHRIIVSSISVIKRACTEALTRGTRQIYVTLNEALSSFHKQKLDALLKLREGSKLTTIVCLRQFPGEAPWAYANSIFCFFVGYPLR